MSTATTEATTTTAAAASTTAATTAAAATTTAASGVSEPWVKDFITPDFSLNHKALERLPDHLKGMAPTLQKYTTFEDMLTGFQSQQVLLGKKALAPLPADATDAVKAERKALIDSINGVPGKPQEYGIAKPADLPDAAWNQPLAETFVNWAHRNSVPPGAVKEIIGLVSENTKQQLAAQQQGETQFWQAQQQTFEATLKRDNISLDRAQALVEKGAIALGMDLENEQTKTFLKGSDARLMAMRHAIAIGEDSVVTGESRAGGEGNPAELARDAQSNPANPLYAQYWNKDGKFSRSVQEAAVAKVNAWIQLAEAKSGGRARR